MHSAVQPVCLPSRAVLLCRPYVPARPDSTVKGISFVGNFRVALCHIKDDRRIIADGGEHAVFA